MKSLKNYWILLPSLIFLIGCPWSKSAEEPQPVQVVGTNTLKISAAAMANLKFAVADTIDFPETLSLMGKIAAREDKTYVVPARAPGRIESVLVASGEAVTAGRPLATVFSPDFVAAREEYIQSARKEKSVNNSSDGGDFKGLARLARKKLESMGLSKEDIESLTKEAATSGETESGKSTSLMVRAPRAGVLLTKNAVVGNMVNLGDAFFTIADLHQVWFLGDVYPEDLPKIKTGQDVILGGTPSNQPLMGKVSFISPVVDSSTRTIKVRVLVDNPTLELRADMYLQGNLVLNRSRALMVPTHAIVRDQEATYVFRSTPLEPVDGRTSGVEVQRIKVAISGEHDDKTAISEGLKQGDQVVSDGALLLNAALNNSGK